MVTTYTAPLVFSKDGVASVDEDLSLALVFWILESGREEGGGIFRKKKAEQITQVSNLHRPLMITKYGSNFVVFDGCDINSTRFKYGLAPSLTYLLSYLASDNWNSKPDSYAQGLSTHAQDFERAREAYGYEVRGWITNPDLLNPISQLLKVSRSTDQSSHALPQSLDFDKARSSLSDLDKLKQVIRNEITPLGIIKQKVGEKTAEILTPLKKECSSIEDKYNKEIQKVRPSVVERKEKIERQRLEQRRQIESRFTGRLQDLRDKRDAAVSKIEAFDPETGRREPRGGIDKQYSIKKNAEHRIKELEQEQEDQVSTLNEKYEALIDEQQRRLDSLEEQKQASLQEPRRKMLAVNGATSRCIQAIDALVQTHNSVINLGLSSGIIVPSNIDFGEFLLYLPVVAALFSDGVTSRTTLYSPTSLKDGKGVVGSLKSFMGMQFSPIEPLNPSFVEFSESIAKNPKTRDIFSACSKAYNLLQDPQTRALIHSGMAKMQTQGWIKEKETAEFRRSMGENFAAITSQSTPVDTRYVASNRVEEAATGTAQTVRFVTYQGLERQVRIDELESLRKEDADQFNKQNPSVDYSAGYSTEIRDFLTTLRIPHNKQYCIEHSEDWVQNQLYALLANSQFQTNLHREQTFNVGDLEARIDFDVDGVGIEVKIFRGMQDFDRLTREMLVYGKEYSEILIPYINAGGLSNEQLETALSLLSEHYPQVKGHFALNCADLF